MFRNSQKLPLIDEPTTESLTLRDSVSHRDILLAAVTHSCIYTTLHTLDRLLAASAINRLQSLPRNPLGPLQDVILIAQQRRDFLPTINLARPVHPLGKHQTSHWLLGFRLSHSFRGQECGVGEKLGWTTPPYHQPTSKPRASPQIFDLQCVSTSPFLPTIHLSH